MTENRGAYINIGPDYKLKFTQFDAVPHPNIRPMVSSTKLHPRRSPANMFSGLCPEFRDVLAHVNMVATNAKTETACRIERSLHTPHSTRGCCDLAFRWPRMALLCRWWMGCQIFREIAIMGGREAPSEPTPCHVSMGIPC